MNSQEYRNLQESYIEKLSEKTKEISKITSKTDTWTPYQIRMRGKL